ncbi:Spy/CpxP family protein refolding chaperone [Kaarinaea lacus]
MKPISKRIMTILISGAVVIGTVTACGHHRYQDPEKHGAWLMEKVTDELELNDSQKAKLEAVRKEILTVRKDMHADRENFRDEILTMLDQPALDRQKALSMVEQKTQSINQHAPQVINALAEFYDSLSDEQRKELREHIADMGQHHHHYW